MTCPQSPEWLMASDAWRRARDAELHFDTNTWSPLVAGELSAPPEIEAEMTRLQEVRIAAEERMMDTPAPTPADLLMKIVAWRERWDGFEWGDEQWAPILADLTRLASPGIAVDQGAI